MRVRFGRLALIFLAGAIAGTLDLGFAAYLAHGRGVALQHMLQSIAAGVLGRASYSMGEASAAVGIVCHYGIAFTMALVFYAMAREWRVLLQRPAITAVIYGTALYLVMEFLVVPLSKAPFTLKEDAPSVARSLLSHILFVAYPIILLANCALADKSAAYRVSRSRPAQTRSERSTEVVAVAEQWIAAPPELVHRYFCDFGRWPDIFECIVDAQLVDHHGNQMVISVVHMKSGIVDNRLRPGPGLQAELQETKTCYRGTFRNAFFARDGGTLYRIKARIRLRGFCHLALLLPASLRTAIAARQVRHRVLLPMKAYAEKLALG